MVNSLPKCKVLRAAAFALRMEPHEFPDIDNASPNALAEFNHRRAQLKDFVAVLPRWEPIWVDFSAPDRIAN